MCVCVCVCVCVCRASWVHGDRSWRRDGVRTPHHTTPRHVLAQCCLELTQDGLLYELWMNRSPLEYCVDMLDTRNVFTVHRFLSISSSHVLKGSFAHPHKCHEGEAQRFPDIDDRCRYIISRLLLLIRHYHIGHTASHSVRVISVLRGRD